MLRKLFKSKTEKSNQDFTPNTYCWWDLLALPAWVLVCFLGAELLVSGLDYVLTYFNIETVVIPTIYNSLITALVYIIVIILAIFVPRHVPRLKRYRISKENLGISRLPAWKDILLVPAGLVIYFVLSMVFVLIASRLIPGFNINQVQDTGFDNLHSNFEYIFGFVTLIIIVPLAEETLFRGYLYGKLRKSLPIWLAIIAVGVIFGALHGAWNVVIDTFTLSLVLCALRETTGSIWASVLLHMTKNGIAFYFLFINPVLLHTLGS